MLCLCEVDFHGFGARCERPLGHKGVHVWRGSASMMDTVGKAEEQIFNEADVEVIWAKARKAVGPEPRVKTGKKSVRPAPKRLTFAEEIKIMFQEGTRTKKK